MAPPKIKLELYQHKDNSLPADASVHAVTTGDGFSLRLGLWPVPGFRIAVLEKNTPDATPVTSEPLEQDPPPDESEGPPANDAESGAGGGAAKPSATGDLTAAEPSADVQTAREPENAAAPDDAGDKNRDEFTGPEQQDGEPEAAAAPEMKAPETKTGDEAANSREAGAGPEAAEVKADAAETGSGERGRPMDKSAPDRSRADKPEAEAAQSNRQGTQTRTGETKTGIAVAETDAADPPADEAAETAAVEPAEAAEDAGPEVEMNGTVIILNGRTEFIEKYAEVIGELIERRFCVAALDWRGQGGSERIIKRNPRKGHVDNMDSYVEYLTSLLDFLESTNCPKPYFCLAHSTGGQVLLRAAPLVANRISRAVAIAPFLELAPRGLESRMIYGLASILTHAGFGRFYAPGNSRTPANSEPFEGNLLSADPERYQRTAALIADFGDLAIGGPTFSWIYAALKSAREICQPEFVTRITLPILMLSASEDKIVSTRAVEDFAGIARTVTHIGIPGARHEILMERDEIRAQFWAAFDAFIPGNG